MHSGSVQRFGSYLQAKWASPRRIRFWLLVLVILYTLFGFFGLPWMVQYFAETTVREDFGRELRIASVQTNPYTLTLRIDGLELNDTDERQLLGWNRLFVDLSWSSITNKAWTFETIRLDQPIVQEERFVSGETRLSRLAAAGAGEPPATEEAEPLPAVQIKELRVNGGVVRFADNLKSTLKDSAEPTQVSLALQDIGVSVDDFNLEDGTRFPVVLQAQLAEGGKFTVDGQLQLLPAPAVEANAGISELALAQAEPYLRQFINVRLASGTLSLEGEIQSDAEQPLAFIGAGGVEALSIKNGANDEALIGWHSLQTQEFKLNLGARQIETDPLIVQGLSGRVVIYEDQTTNFGQLLVGSAGAADSNDSGPDDGGSNGATNSAKSDTPFAIAIESIKLNDGGLQFADNSLPLPFSTRIHSLNGEISTLSSTSAEPARVQLEGEVAEYGLVSIDGAVHAWHPTRQTNVQLSFRNLQIPEYSPYTVNFAGRKIAGGTMDLDLDYSIDENQLDGSNNVVLHDLKLGEKMASSDAMDLPLNLAIALLQDSNGVIDLTLPVSGNVGNPQFDFSKIIKQAIGNAITSVVTAPFSFLASLVGGNAEDLGQVEFLAGRSDLLPPQRQRIVKLREALNQRPQLILELAGPYNKRFDSPPLQREKAIEALQQRLAEEGRDVADPSLTAESNQAIVETMFSSLYPKTRLDVLKDYFTEEADEAGGDANFDALAYRTYLAEQVIAAQTVTDAELKVLANARATAVRQALVNPDADATVAADRIRILSPKQVDDVEGERIDLEVGVSAD
ncbi:DUF748 domain-containing protein [Pseudidiomarina halophila]|uniref:DUF748 domain-containing protein n=1 Tax=Pseudidiomarina halophila TaxID=1449799 RepID=A0A432XVN7_9GAMM|nr:DUF748 domain-containing protein [Pseudidiomarina halophila]RUO52796.1 hypothetical protein CWI69_07060 [Pseudidiomarina halophila]